MRENFDRAVRTADRLGTRMCRLLGRIFAAAREYDARTHARGENRHDVELRLSMSFKRSRECNRETKHSGTELPTELNLLLGTVL